MSFLSNRQVWFKNARAQRRRRIQLQKATYTDQDLKRWKRRMALRRSLNGSPLVLDADSTFQQQPLPACDFEADVQLPLRQNPCDHVTPLPATILPLVTTPALKQTTPMPESIPAEWYCCGPVREPALLSDLIVSQPAYEKTKAFYDSSFKTLFGQLFDSLLKDERMI